MTASSAHDRRQSSTDRRPVKTAIDDKGGVGKRAIKESDGPDRPMLVCAIAASQCGLAPRPGLEPGTCGLTVQRSNYPQR